MKRVLSVVTLLLSVFVCKGVHTKMEKFILAPLPYGFNALEPHLDARTVELHYTKHHQGYVDKLNIALEKHVDQYGKAKKTERFLQDLLTNLDQVPADIRTAVRNQGGGVFVHDLFWRCMAPATDQIREPQGLLKTAIEKSFGSLADFKKKFEEAAIGHFGSGWAWLVVDKNGDLKIVSTVNHDIPQRDGLKPILVVDVWEHAYYLRFQNRRAEFLTAWWNVVNWPYVEELFAKN